MGYIKDQLYEVELVRSEIEHKEPIIVEFVILHFAKLRMLQLYYNSFDKYCDVKKFEELEMDKGSLYLALLEDNLYGCFRPAMKNCGAFCGLKTVRMNFQPTEQQIFSLVLLIGRLSLNIRSTIDENLAFSKKNCIAQK